jgi:hypothetical protein
MWFLIFREVCRTCGELRNVGSVLTRVRVKRPRVRNPARVGELSFLKSFRLALGPSEPPIQRVADFLPGT